MSGIEAHLHYLIGGGSIIGELSRRAVDLSAVAQGIALELKKANPARHVEFVIAPRLGVNGDANLLRIMLENLL